MAKQSKLGSKFFCPIWRSSTWRADTAPTRTPYRRNAVQLFTEMKNDDAIDVIESMRRATNEISVTEQRMGASSERRHLNQIEAS